MWVRFTDGDCVHVTGLSSTAKASLCADGHTVPLKGTASAVLAWVVGKGAVFADRRLVAPWFPEDRAKAACHDTELGGPNQVKNARKSLRDAAEAHPDPVVKRALERLWDRLYEDAWKPTPDDPGSSPRSTSGRRRQTAELITSLVLTNVEAVGHEDPVTCLVDRWVQETSGLTVVYGSGVYAQDAKETCEHYGLVTDARYIAELCALVATRAAELGRRFTVDDRLDIDVVEEIAVCGGRAPSLDGRSVLLVGLGDVNAATALWVEHVIGEGGLGLAARPTFGRSKVIAAGKDQYDPGDHGRKGMLAVTDSPWGRGWAVVVAGPRGLGTSAALHHLRDIVRDRMDLPAPQSVIVEGRERDYGIREHLRTPKLWEDNGTHRVRSLASIRVL
jgi:hypothetical protein